MERLSVSEALNQKRLDVVLSTHSKIASRSEAQRHIREGVVQVNHSHERVSAKRLVHSGDIITFTIMPQQISELVPVPFNLDICFEDEYLLVVNKPRGVVVHPAAGHANDTLVNFLLHHTRLPGLDPLRPGIVHRIDKDTSGLLVIAKDTTTHEHLAKQFFNHSVSRIYQAIVWGVPIPLEGMINKPLGRHPKNRKKIAIREDGKSAVTHWKVIKSFHYLSHLQCRLETGRTHQIRVHLSSMGHPLLGDTLYGSFRQFAGKFPEELRTQLRKTEGQALHAGSLGFVHPKTGEWLEYHSDLPEDMKNLLATLDVFLS